MNRKILFTAVAATICSLYASSGGYAKAPTHVAQTENEPTVASEIPKLSLAQRRQLAETILEQIKIVALAPGDYETLSRYSRFAIDLKATGAFKYGWVNPQEFEGYKRMTGKKFAEFMFSIAKQQAANGTDNMGAIFFTLCGLYEAGGFEETNIKFEEFLAVNKKGAENGLPDDWANLRKFIARRDKKSMTFSEERESFMRDVIRAGGLPKELHISKEDLASAGLVVMPDGLLKIWKSPRPRSPAPALSHP